jgi:hypothetical protein
VVRVEDIVHDPVYIFNPDHYIGIGIVNTTLSYKYCTGIGEYCAE